MSERMHRLVSNPIGTWLKVFFWLGVFSTFYSCSDTAVPIQHLDIWYPLDAALLFPAMFINQRRYQAPAVILFCITATATYLTLRH